MAKFYLLAILAVIVSIITLASFLKFQRFAFFNKTNNDKYRDIREVPFPMIFSMVVLSIICVVLSLLVIPEIRDTFLTPAINILTDPVKYSTLILGQ
jgi:multicomponent Na+:H+ antiporter subunit D